MQVGSSSGINGTLSSLGNAAQQRAAMNNALEQRSRALSVTGVGPSDASLLATLGSQRSLYPAQYDFLPGGLPVNPAFTRVTPLKKTDTLPDISAEEQARIKQWVAKDNWSAELHAHDRRLAKNGMEQLAGAYLKSADWLGNIPGPSAGTAWAHAPAGGAFNVRSTAERAHLMRQGKRKSRVDAVLPRSKLSPHVLSSFSEEEEWLIPIRLEFEHETQKIRDVFTWNMRDTQITPELFVRMLLEDLMLPQHPFQKELISQINAQMEDAKRIAFRDNVFAQRTDDEIHEDEIHDDVDEAFWRSWRKRIKLEDGGRANEKDVRVDLEELRAHEELRIVIKLDVTSGTWQLVDQFEWDIADPRNVPEHFAKSYAADLGLPGEFVTAIAHSIREQSETFAKSLGLIEHRPGNPVIHEELRSSFLPPLSETVRSDPSTVNQFTPYLQELTQDDLERHEKERERDFRRKRRQTRGRQAVTLPDREPIKTHRTFMPMPGAQPIEARMDEDNDHVVVPALPIARPYPIIRRFANVPKPIPMLPEDNVDANKSKPPRDLQPGKRGRGRGRWPRAQVAERAPSQTPTIAPATPSGSSEWQPKAESPGAGSPLEMPHTEAATATSKRPFAKKGGGTRKKNRYGSPTAEELASQHENYINGVWHCANCGGPDGIKTGRRLGPKGKDTLCSECGKYFHRNRKSRPCEYNTSAEHHIALKRADEAAKQAALAAASRESSFVAHPTNSSPSDDSDDEPIVRRTRRPPPRDDDYVQGYHQPADPHASVRKVSDPSSNRFVPAPPGPVMRPPPSLHNAAIRQSPPAWMLQAAAELRATKPDDRFDIIARPKPPTDASGVVEWRVRCADCPGKLYTPGPDETLDNFSVHLKNRSHRANVDKRLGRIPADQA